VIRHAVASHCAVALHSADGWLRVQVSDDGVGLHQPHRDGIGMSSMRERAAELGGSFRVDSRPGRGARITANLPVPVRVPS
jgi:signal transduction histidine kinase